MPFLDRPITNFVDSDGVDLGRKLVTKDYLLEVYGTILESSGATGLVVTPELWVWGWNISAQLGLNIYGGGGVALNRSIPVTTFAGGTNWKQVSCANQHTAAIKTDGSLWTWGLNSSGQLGTNDTSIKSVPVTTFAGGTDWKQVSIIGSNTAAIKTDGSLWTWGFNSSGQLGDNTTTNRSTPVTTFAGGNNWKQVSCGTNHTAAIKTDGSLWTWGANNVVQLGINGYGGNRSTPVTTFAGGTTWKSVACAIAHTLAIKTDGTLWVWGTNDNGQLGINQVSFRRSVPVTTFAGGTNWKSVYGGDGQTSAAIKTDGSLWMWGINSSGQLGINNTANRSIPVTTFAGGNNWKQVSGGVAIKTDGTLWVWGGGSNGRLGTNDEITRSTPVTTFAGGNNWKQVSAGGQHIAAIQTIDYI